MSQKGQLRPVDRMLLLHKHLTQLCLDSVRHVKAPIQPTFTYEEVVRGTLQQALVQPGLQGSQQRLHALVQDLQHHCRLLTTCKVTEGSA